MEADYSLYPINGHVVAAFRDELTQYQRSTGTVCLPLSQAVPVRLIGRIARFRAKEVVEHAKTKKVAPNKR